MHIIKKLLNISLDKHLLSVHIVASMTILALATVHLILALVLFASKYKCVCLMSEFALKYLRLTKTALLRLSLFCYVTSVCFYVFTDVSGHPIGPISRIRIDSRRWDRWGVPKRQLTYIDVCC
jgi:hypothetical protein